MGIAYIATFLIFVLGVPLLDDLGLWAVAAPLAGCAFVGLVLHLVRGWWRFGSGLLWTTGLVGFVYWAFLVWRPMAA
jgi:hypothetical protein